MSGFRNFVKTTSLFGLKQSQHPNSPPNTHTLTLNDGNETVIADGLTLDQLIQLREQLHRYLHQHGIPSPAYPPAPQNPPAGQQGTQRP